MAPFSLLSWQNAQALAKSISMAIRRLKRMPCSMVSGVRVWPWVKSFSDLHWKVCSWNYSANTSSKGATTHRLKRMSFRNLETVSRSISPSMKAPPHASSTLISSATSFSRKKNSLKRSSLKRAVGSPSSPAMTSTQKRSLLAIWKR